jgi:hypothetical protein
MAFQPKTNERGIFENTRNDLQVNLIELELPEEAEVSRPPTLSSLATSGCSSRVSTRRFVIPSRARTALRPQTC